MHAYGMVGYGMVGYGMVGYGLHPLLFLFFSPMHAYGMDRHVRKISPFFGNGRQRSSRCEGWQVLVVRQKNPINQGSITFLRGSMANKIVIK